MKQNPMSIRTMVLQVTLRRSCSHETPFLCIELNASTTEVPMMNTNLAKGLKTVLLSHTEAYCVISTLGITTDMCAFEIFALVNAKDFCMSKNIEGIVD